MSGKSNKLYNSFIFSSLNRHYPRFFSFVISLGILFWFFARSWRGLLVSFTGDDIMNIYWSCEASWGRLLFANFLPFTSEYRPLGAICYRVLYELFGLNPIPFRIFFYTVLICNAYLLFRLGRALTSSLEIGILAATLGCFHPRMFDIYLNNGTIYDVLCATFYLLGVIVYVEARLKGTLTFGCVLLILGLEAAAINSKETGITIPLMLLAYEWVYHRDALMRRDRPELRKFVTIVGSILIAFGAAASRFQAGSRLIHNESYHLRISLKQYLATTKKFYENLFYLDEHLLIPIAVFFMVLSLVAISTVSKSKPIQFAALFVLITPLPVNFIPARELYAAYVSVFGWAILASTTLVAFRKRVYAWLWGTGAPAQGAIHPEQCWLLLCVLIVISALEIHDRPISWQDGLCPNNKVCTYLQDLSLLRPKMNTKDAVLLLSDGFEDGDWTPILAYRLARHDLTITIDRAVFLGHILSAPEQSQYHYVIRHNGKHLELMPIGIK